MRTEGLFRFVPPMNLTKWLYRGGRPNWVATALAIQPSTFRAPASSAIQAAAICWWGARKKLRPRWRPS